MSNLIKHAERELKLAGLHKKDSDYNGALYDSVMKLMRVFSKQGHSGFSANQTIRLFSMVAAFKNLVPLTGKDNEWNEVNNNTLQNKRVFGVFKEKDTGKAYYLDAIVWKTQKNTTWIGSANGIKSRQYIKSFPFTPKTFVIDVVEREIGKGDWEFKIKNREQLKEVYEYYKEDK